MTSLLQHIERELEIAVEHENAGRLDHALRRLERAHVLGQATTYQHTRIHWRMFKLGLKMRSAREVWGQIIRIVGAATKTPLGIYPTGNTGASNAWFFERMTIPDDLRDVLERSR
jgi:hypothetical protein